ncbi:MAG: IS21-like element helper ATPase IstB [Gammaproteobacteria bacterium]|nr:IS21-like element helper ATPase IstB [Gammaproteobacteria bacterium]MCW5584410.1 IS21-like element helper ATPase IstB [Gammaproteobacteria bacterium]
MLNQPTLEKLRALKLTGMANALQEQLQKPLPDLDFETRLGILVDQEWLIRENRKLQRRLSQAKLQQSACIEDIDYEKPRGLAKAKILELSRSQWLQQRLNLLITGPTGCGKTYVACALAHRACLDGFTSRYYRLPRLWEELKIAKANGTYSYWLVQLAKIDLLILDDWGLVTPDIERRQDLLEILDDRYQKKSTIVTSQIPTTHWHEHLNDATLADAILDRLLHNSIRLELKGDSMRKNQKSLQKATE